MARVAAPATAIPQGHAESPRVVRSAVDQWRLVGAVCGPVAFAVYMVGAAAPLTPAQGAVVAAVFGPGVICASLGLYQVLRLRRRTVTGDLGALANIVAGVTVTLMLFAQLGLKGWFEGEFGDGATDSTDPSLHAAFEAANGLQLGLDVAWDVFIAAGTVLLAVNMWSHPRFGRVLAGAGIGIATVLLVLNLAMFPEPPGRGAAFDPGPLVGLWYVVVCVRLAQSGQWVVDAERREPSTGLAR